MEAESIVLPDNTVIDTSIPPPGYNFPKPDFSAVITDDTEASPASEKIETPITKPTFKNALQAKKRLQAFSTNRAGSLPSSPLAKKIKPTLNTNTEEKLEESPVKKTPKKSNYHDDKAKAVIEEIEELKREEFLRYTPRKARSESHSRSRSRSPNKERFKRVEKKARNYRRRSPTPEKPKKVHRKPKKYPKNWHEFVEFDSDFELNREFDIPSPKGNNELMRQILFESPSLPITQFKMKTVKNEEKVVPFDYIRYTRTKPVLPYSVNCVAIQDKFLPRKLILDSLPKDVAANIVNLYSNSLKFKIDSNVKIKARNWFPKVWKDSDNENECKLLEKSVGLSFLQTYTGEEEENDSIEEVTLIEMKEKKEKRLEEKKEKDERVEEETEKEEKRMEEKKEKEEKRAEERKEKEEKRLEEKKEKVEKRIEEKKEKEEKRVEESKAKEEKRIEEKKEKEEKRVEEKKEREDQRAEEKKEKEEKRALEKKDREEKRAKKEMEDKDIPTEEKKERTEEPKSETRAKVENRKKKKKKKTELAEENVDNVAEKKKKRKRGNKEKKKHVDENTEQGTAKKKKRKKDKSKKKEKRSKDKKSRHKKVPKEKKNKEKTPQEEEKLLEKHVEKPIEKPVEKPIEKPVEKPNKQQVMEELRIIEEKLAKKREQEKAKIEKKAEKEEKYGKEKGKKRKHSEREEISKKAKHEKHKDLVNSEIRTSEITSKKKKIDETKLEEKPRKHFDKGRSKSSEDVKKNDHRKSKCFEEIAQKTRMKKSRWSEPVKKEELEYTTKMNIAEEIKRIDEVIKKHENLARNEERKPMEESQTNEEIMKERTPDTDEYHSHWESDDDISSSVRRRSVKLNRSWESDEELFERTYNRNKTQSQSYTDLEIPLNIKTFSRRTKWDEKPSSYVDTRTEFKLLEEERRNLSEERRKLELEKQRILQLQEEAKLDANEKKVALEELPKEKIRMRSSTPEVEVVKVKKEKCDILDFNIDSLNNSILSNVSSTESNYPIAVLENEYEEFIKAVSSDTSAPTKKKERRTSKDSSSSSSSSSDSDHKKKKRRKKKKKRKKRECEGLLLGKGNNIFNEFDIPVPSDLPEMVPTPVPVPSPIETILPLTPSSLLLNSIIEIAEKPVLEETTEPPLSLTKPFVFSSIVLPSKKNPLLENSKLKLDDSDSADFTDKFVKKVEEIEVKPPEKIEEKEEIAPVEITPEVEAKQAEVALDQIELPKERSTEETDKIPESESKKIVEEKPKLPETKEVAKSGDGDNKIKRSLSPERIIKDRKRSRTRSRERELRRRSPIRRRESSPPRRRFSSPRRRSPPRRRSSPRRRSPSPRRRSPSPRRRLSPLRRRRRSPSLSPPRSRGGARKRTPSPRRRASPLNSPLDGFKRSVADSTISDDMLPQPTPEDYVESPPSYREGKYYDRKKRGSLSPQNSPKRIPLDDRISLVLGLEKNEPPPLPPKPPEAYPNYNYGVYNQQYNQYPQYNQFPKSEYVAPFAPSVFTQPPPPIVKPTPTKVVQVGNILQVVPNEEISQTVVETKPRETSQKIVQVGNMLQIVPAVIPPPAKPPVVEPPPPPLPPPTPKPVPMPEKQSAEALMKQKIAERKAERERRRQERERRRKEKEKKRKEKEKRKQMKLKIKTENMIKRAIQLEAEALACEDIEEEGENPEVPVQWPPVSVVISTTPSGKGILVGEGSSRKRKSVQFADGVRPGEGTSPSGGEELSSPPPNPPRLPKEKRYKKVKIPKKSKKKKIKVKVVKKKVQNLDDGDDDDEDDNLPPPSPPPGSPPPHVFPSRVKTHTINNVHQYVGNIIPTTAAAFPFRPPMPVVINRHQPPPGYMQAAYHSDVSGLSHPAYQGVSSHH